MNDEMDLITVDVGDLKEKVLAKFLQSKLRVPVRIGDEPAVLGFSLNLC
jgi:hypothetical protein